ncbi:hypothetical protein GCM10020358_67460 [Amorphoplanes nipponensis]|uniref:Uncharacterized protein n=1 Tax=Actinoplanes nipponensis TaxID=135950 RepID=A0A919JLX1_9ACTN|nr:hypothetical protein Ani05nite_51640 [Actinoplanes nipponensis]
MSRHHQQWIGGGGVHGDADLGVGKRRVADGAVTTGLDPARKIIGRALAKVAPDFGCDKELGRVHCGAFRRRQERFIP